MTSWILTLSARLDAADQVALKQITSRCEEIEVTCDLVRQFVGMLGARRGQNLPDWAAVTARLTLPHSSGTTEGHVNRIKMIKRQMYGRANPDLLRKRILLAD